MLLTVVYNLVIGAALAAGIYVLVQSHKDAKEHILHASELRQAALTYVGRHCSDFALPVNVNKDRLINSGHLPASFNDHGVKLRLRLQDYPHGLLVTEGEDPFKVYLDSRDMGEPGSGGRWRNRFSPDTGAHRVANGGLNLMLVNGHKFRCEAPADRAALWTALCEGLQDSNPDMTCNPWSEEP